MNKKQLNDCQKLINQLKLIYKKQEWQHFIDVDTKLQNILEKMLQIRFQNRPKIDIKNISEKHIPKISESCPKWNSRLPPGDPR